MESAVWRQRGKNPGTELSSLPFILFLQHRIPGPGMILAPLGWDLKGDPPTSANLIWILPHRDAQSLVS